MIAIGQFTIVDLEDITVSATAPINPSNGLLWLDTTNDELKIYNGTSWEAATKYTDDSSLTTFITGSYANKVNELQNEIDTKVTTWYYSGMPTLSNAPANTWSTNAIKDKHLKDLYYDKATGYTYIFDKASNVYSWAKIEDADIVEAMALANSAQDTADGKRQIFTSTPATPYDNGDLWIRNQEIYICQISKSVSESYAEGDFIIATKYTDDTVANQVGDNLEVVRGTVTQVQQGVDAFKIDINTTVKTISDSQKETIEAVENMNYTFGTKDLTIANSNDPVNARINNQGLKVYSYNNLQAIFNHKGTGVNKLIVVGDSQIGNISIIKTIDDNGDACTDFNYLVSNIQDLSDLE